MFWVFCNTSWEGQCEGTIVLHITLYPVSKMRPWHVWVYSQLLFMSLFPVCLEHRQMDKVLHEQREQHSCCSEQLRWEKCHERSETADTSFPFIACFEATIFTEYFVRVGLFSRRPGVPTVETQHMLSRKLFLVSHLFRRLLFVWTSTASYLLFLREYRGRHFFQTGWRSFCGSVLWLLSLLSLFFFFPEM